MNKIKALKKLAEETQSNVLFAIKSLTEENSLIFFTSENVNEETVNCFPVGYFVGKYESYNEGVVQEVKGNDVMLFQTGESFGETFTLELNQLPYDSLIQILGCLELRVQD